MLTEDVLSYFRRLHPDENPRLVAARTLGITKSAVYGWGAQVPPLSAALLEKRTDGDLIWDPDAYDELPAKPNKRRAVA